MRVCPPPPAPEPVSTFRGRGAACKSRESALKSRKPFGNPLCHKGSRGASAPKNLKNPNGPRRAGVPGGPRHALHDEPPSSPRASRILRNPPSQGPAPHLRAHRRELKFQKSPTARERIFTPDRSRFSPFPRSSPPWSLADETSADTSRRGFHRGFPPAIPPTPGSFLSGKRIPLVAGGFAGGFCGFLPGFLPGFIGLPLCFSLSFPAPAPRRSPSVLYL